MSPMRHDLQSSRSTCSWLARLNEVRWDRYSPDRWEAYEQILRHREDLRPRVEARYESIPRYA